MLEITIPKGEEWDEANEQFVYTDEVHLVLEHSLLSISKWESKWEKPFFSRKDKTLEEALDYIRCMTITKNVKPETYYLLSEENLNDINNYIQKKMTATTFSNLGHRPSREIVTSEIIYYQMVTLGIPFECEKWHINRLLTLIKVCSIKNNPKKKRIGKHELASRNRALNAARKAKLHTHG